MARSRKALLQIPVVLLALASTPGLFVVSVSTFMNPATAQSTNEELTEEERTLTLPKTFDSKPSFTVPQSLAEDTEVTLDGSSSMIGLNRVLEERFEERFPNSDVELSATGTPGALEAVRNGDLDIAAVGRLLTEEEKDAGLVAVPVGREKLAIIVSPDNPFDGNLTFEQFAQIFRGEITNWSEVGGPDQEIEFVDRPDDSDTRFALSTYDVFEVAPFETGFNTTQVNEDTTDAVVAELGDNGIGYAIADQVVNRDDVKIISMHQTLPDDPRYPYSQYRSYVYNENNTTPAVVAFLGLASTTPVQGGAAGVVPTAIPRGEDDEGVVPVAPVAPVAGGESNPDSVAQVPSAAPIAQDETGGFPWWLVLLLGIPLIGGLLLWLLKGGQGTPIADTTPPPTTGTTPPPATGTGTATPPPTTGTGVATPPPTTGAVIPPVTETPPPVTDNGVTPLTTPPAPPTVPPVPPSVTTPPVTPGGISVPPGLGAIAGVGGLIGAAAWWAGREPDSRITLAPGDGQEAYAYWNVPDGDKNFAKENGGRHPQLRIYDVTGIEDPDRQKPSKVQKYDWDELTKERQVSDLEGNRDYLAEIGYETDDAQWLMLARSNQIHIQEREIPTAGITPGVRAVIPALLGAGGAAALIPMLTRFGSHITLKLADTPTSATSATLGTSPLGTSQTAEAYWEVPNDAIRAAKNNGGQYPQVRLCDVTGLDDLDREQPHYIDKYDWDEASQTQIFPDLERDRTYLAEIGYETDDQQWLRLARSNRVTIPSVDRFAEDNTPNVELVPGLVGAGVIGAGGAAALIPLLTSHGSHITLRLTDTPSSTEATWEVPDIAKTIAKEHGGQYPQVRLCDVTGLDDVDRQTPNNIQKYDWDQVSTSRVFPSLEPDRTYLAEIGYETEDREWLRLARSNRVTIPAESSDISLPGVIGLSGIAAILPVLTRYGSHITLRLIDTPTSATLGTSQAAEAYWEVPDAAKAKAKEYGGPYPQVRLCDVTGVDDVDRQTPNQTQKYSWDEFSRNRVFPSLEPDRTYLAEIGYETEDQQWLRLARSNRVTVPVETPDFTEVLDGGAATVTPPAVETPDAGIVPGLIGLGGIAAILPVLTRYGSHITLSLTDTPTSATSATLGTSPLGTSQTTEAYWEVPTEAKAKAKEYGGLYPQVRLCDVTGIDDVDYQTPNNIQKYEWNEWTQRQQFPNLERDRIYLAEIGYETDDEQWLRVARSNRVTIPAVETPITGSITDIGVPGLVGVGTLAPPDSETTPDIEIAPGLGVIALIPILTRYGSHITLGSTDTPRTLAANWEVPNSAKTAAKGYGGQSPQVRLCDVTGIDDVDREIPLDIQKYHWDEFSQEQVFSDLDRDRIYLAEIGYEMDDEQWLRLARSNRVNILEVETPDAGLIGVGGQPQIPSSEVPSGERETPTTAETGISPGVIGAGLIGLGGAALIPALARYGSQITLRLTDIPQTAQAAWNVPEGAKNAAKELGGRQMQLRIYDVTNVADLETQSPNRVRRYDCEESAQERRIPIEDQNCEYLAEIGYITDDGQWLMLARSNRVAVPETVVETPTQPTETVSVPPLSSFPSSIVLIPTGEDAIDIRWEIPDEAKEVAKGQGGRKLQLRVYDLTNTTGDRPGGTLIKQQDCDESDWQFRLEDDTSDSDSPRGERDYLGEIGYETDNGEWIVVACSEPIHIPADRPDAGVSVEPLPGERTSSTTSSVTLVPSDNSTANVYWIVPDVVQAEAKRQGGNQFQLHVYDVTDISPDSVATHNVEQYNFDPSLSSPQLLQLEGDREYFAEIGYLTDNGEWLMVARSYRVRIPVATTRITPEEQPNLELSLREPAVIPSLDENRCRVSLIPSDNETANVYWEVPEAAIEDVIRQGGRQFQLHIYDVTDIPADSVATHSLQQYDFNVALPHPELLHLEGNHEYFAEIGYLTNDGEWLRLARSYRVRIPAMTTTDIPDLTLVPGIIAIPGLASIPCRMVLSLEDEGVVEAEWDVPDAAKALAKQEGGYQFQVRAYDVTDTPVETATSAALTSDSIGASGTSPSNLVEECPIAESISTWEFELESDREYLAEVGYISEDGRWLVLARSNRLFVPSEETEDESTGSAPIAFMGTAETEQPLDESSSYITLSIADDEWVDARWEVPNAVKVSAKEQGGQKFQLHVYEVTDIDITTQPAHGVQRYNCNELIKQWQVPNLKPNSEYLVEIGYVTDGAEWLMLARSNRVRVPEPTVVTRDLTNVSPGEIAPCQITLVVIDNYSADAHWEVPRLAREAAKQQGGRKFQLRIYDVTGIDVETQSATIIRRYNCHELVQQLQIPNLGTNRDYLVEMGYVTDDEQWMILARSNSVRIVGTNAAIVEPEATRRTPSPGVNLDQVETVTPEQPLTTGNCAIQHLTVHSRRNCHLLTSACMKQVEEKAVSLSLEPGIYVLRIKSGTFGYGPTFVGEPFIIIWIYGGKVINKKTRVPVAATWSTLNGYHETLTLEVQETSQLSAFFFDTYPDDNEGAVTLSVVRLYDAP